VIGHVSWFCFYPYRVFSCWLIAKPGPSSGSLGFAGQFRGGFGESQNSVAILSVGLRVLDGGASKDRLLGILTLLVGWGVSKFSFDFNGLVLCWVIIIIEWRRSYPNNGVAFCHHHGQAKVSFVIASHAGASSFPRMRESSVVRGWKVCVPVGVWVKRVHVRMVAGLNDALVRARGSACGRGIRDWSPAS
jgi:hypothetical protein